MEPVTNSRCRRSRNESREGFTLIEVMIALVVLTIVVIGLGQAILAGQQISRELRHEAKITAYFEQRIEELRNMSLPEITALSSEVYELDGIPNEQGKMIVIDNFLNSDDLIRVQFFWQDKFLFERVLGNTTPTVGEPTSPPEIQPIAVFSGNPTSSTQCPLSVQFSDQSAGYVTSWSWDFGDGNHSVEKNPVHQYNVEGTYTVSLTVSGPGGTDTMVRPDYILVGVQILANFSAIPTVGSAPLEVTFTDESIGDIGSWEWDFDNNGTIDSTTQDTSHTYGAIGNYTVSLTVRSTDGTKTDTKTITSYIKVQPALIVASEHGDPSPAVGEHTYDSGQTVTASVTSPVPGGSGIRYLSDGWEGTGSVPSNGTTSAVTFTILADSSITWKWKTQYQVITQVQPPEGGTVDEPISGSWFNASSNVTFHATANDPFTFSRWMGSLSSTSPTQDVQITEPMNVTALFNRSVLTVISAFGSPCPGVGDHDYLTTDTVNATVETMVETQPGVRHICTGYDVVKDSGTISGSVATVTIPMDQDAELTWHWQTQYWLRTSGSPPTAGNVDVSPIGVDSVTTDGQTVQWYDANTTPINVQLSPYPHTAYDFTEWGGDLSGSTYPVTISMNGPKSIVANFRRKQYDLVIISDFSSCNPPPSKSRREHGESIRADSNTPVFVMDGQRAACTGFTGEGSVPTSSEDTSYVFSIYEDTTIIWGWHTEYRLVTAVRPDDTYGMVYPPGTSWHPEGLIVTVTANSSASYEFTGWTDDLISTNQSEQLTMDGPKKVTAMFSIYALDVVSERGNPTPEEGRHEYGLGAIVNASVEAKVEDPPASGVWYICDGYDGTGSVPSGTGNSVTIEIRENSKITWKWKTSYDLTADFSASPTSGTAPLEVSFTDDSPGVDHSSFWDFGDGDTSNEKNPTHTYTEIGDYTVTLTVASPGGSDSKVRVNYIKVTPELEADFTASPRSGTVPLAVTFDDISIGTIDSWDWNFGSGATPATANTQGPHNVVYDTVGLKTVNLIVTGPAGSDSTMKVDYITVNVPSSLFYVDATRPDDTGDGLSWATAKKTIQAGINVASDFGTVIVADGTYTGAGNVNLTFISGKNITLRSQNGATGCIIDAAGAAATRGFNITVATTSVVKGFTITGASVGDYGGGIYCSGSGVNPTFTSCVITGNSVSSGYSGGGVYIMGGSSTKLVNCMISGNTVPDGGWGGGGVMCKDPATTVTLINCAIVHNAGPRGAGILSDGGTMTLTNCTIASNSASMDGGGVWCVGSATLKNSIIWGNTAATNGQQIYIYDDGVSTVSLNYCCYVDGAANIYGTPSVSSSIVADPLFADAANGNFKLQAGSPCTDTGSNALVPAGTTTDLAGNPRIIDGSDPPDSIVTVDMGAYEYIKEADSAQFISQNVPTEMVSGEQYEVSVTMKNTGSAVWNVDGVWKLGSQNPQDNHTWGVHRVYVDDDPVYYGDEHTFIWTVTAPTTAGDNNFQWKMVHEGVIWFGELTTNVVVTVSIEPPAGPVNFYGDTPTANSIMWHWTDKAVSEEGFEIQEAGAPDIQKADAAAATGSGTVASVTETGLAENAVYTRHCHAYNIVETLRNYSVASNSDTVYTLVHDPTVDDFNMAVTGYGQLSITVTPPGNQAVGDTGVCVERAADAGFTWNKTTVQAFAATYSMPDTPGTGTFYYRIKFRNQLGAETAYSPGKRIVLFASTEYPTNFEGLNPTADTITWHWTDNSADEDGFVVQQPPDVGMAYAASMPGTGAIVSVTETGLSENTAYTRHCRAINNPLGGGETPEIVTAVDGGSTNSNAPLNISEAYSRYQMIYLQSEIGKACYITKMSFYQCDSISVVINNVTVCMQETDASTVNLEWLPPDNGPGTLVFSGDITTRTSPGWCEIVFDTPFPFSNTKNLMVSLRQQDGTAEASAPYWYLTDTGSVRRVYCFGATNPPDPGGANPTMPNTQFEIVSGVMNYSDPSNTDSEYTLIHDPVDADWTTTVGGSGAEALDQQYTETLTGVFTIREGNQLLAQSFAPGMSGQLTKVDVALVRYNNSGFTDGFESGDIASWTTDSNPAGYPWSAATGVVHNGTYSAKSGPFTTLDNNCYSDMSRSITLSADGDVTFWWKVSSESGWDYLIFYIDGGVETYISGEVDWTEVTYPLSAGTHTLLWRYQKDTSAYGGSDCGWVDDVVVTGMGTANPVTIEIRSDSSGYPGTLLTSSTRSDLTPDGTYHWCTFDFASPPSLTAGQTYWISATSPAAADTEYKWAGYSAGTYAGGFAAYDPTTGWTQLPDYDFGFRTWMESASGENSIYISMASPPNPSAGQTGVQVERATNSAFTTGLATVQSFTSNYSLIDTPGTGTFYYKIKYRNQVGTSTAYSPVRRVVVFTSAEIPTGFEGVNPTVDSITWRWTDNSSNEEGFDVQQPGTPDIWKTNAAAMAGTGSTVSVTETGLSENTAYMRHCRAFAIGDFIEGFESGSIADWTTSSSTDAHPWVITSDKHNGTFSVQSTPFTETYNSCYSDLSRTFTLTAAGNVTFWWKVSSETGYDFLKFYIDDDLQPGSIAGSSDWVQRSFDLAPGTHTLLWRYEKDMATTEGTDCGWVDDIAVKGAGRIYTDASNTDTEYTLVHDPLDADWTLSNTASGVSVTVVPPPNSAQVKVERATNSTFSAGLSTVQNFASNYSLTDTPAAGTYYYRIMFRNQANVDTAYSPGKPVVVGGSAAAPVANFTASPRSGVAPLTVIFEEACSGTIATWSWNFGAGASPATASTEGPHTVTYSTAGLKTVSLTVNGPGGSDAESKTDYISVTDPPTGSIIFVDAARPDDSGAGTSWATAKKTIQAGINAASTGYTVLVADGTYSGTNNYSITFSGKAITLKSANGPNACIIDGLGSNRVFYLYYTYETPSTVIDGFTVKNGYYSSSNGAGMYCYYSAPTVKNCIFDTNKVGSSSYSGGGIYYYYSDAYGSPVLENCTFVNNEAGYGAGICCYNAGVIIKDCTFTTNKAYYRGGGIYAYRSSSSYSYTPTITNCMFYGNEQTYASTTTSYGGGAILFYASSSTYTMSPEVTNCAFYGNTAGYSGGAIHCYQYSSPVFVNCTITNNSHTGSTSSYKKGGGLYIYSYAYPVLKNSIIRGNTAYYGYDAYFYNTTYSTLTMDYCCYDSGASCYYNGTPTVTNCITTDPLLVSGSARIGTGSPCIDTGSNGHVTTATDLAGHTRIGNGIVDMGAYEFVLDSAQFISQNVPLEMVAGEEYTVSVTMKNTGSSIWPVSGNWKLGSQPGGDTTWGMTRVLVSGSDVAPDGEHTFTWTVTAPPSAGDYNFQWRMVDESVCWFGDLTQNVAVTVLVYVAPVAPANFEGVNPTANSITWLWTDNSGDEEGFEVQQPGSPDIWKADAPAMDYYGSPVSVTETGLEENTAYTRQSRAYSTIPGVGAEIEDQSNTTASSSDYYNYNLYMRAQTFTPSVSGKLTKVELYGKKYNTTSYDLKVMIYPTSGDAPDTSGAALAEKMTSGWTTTLGWWTVTFDTPPMLVAGTRYAIVVDTPGASSSSYANYWYYSSGTSYSSGERYTWYNTGPWSLSSAYDYGFKTYMKPDARNYSPASNTDTVYTAVHDPVDADWTTSVGGSGGSAEGTTTITVGNGSGGSYGYPLYSDWNYGRDQMLYLASEIGQAGTITKIRFNQTSCTTAHDMNNVVIHMKETTMTEFASATWQTEGTLVWSGNLHFDPTTGWYEIALTNPFVYSGSQNILVSVYQQDGSYVNASLMWARTSSSPTYRHLTGFSDTENPPQTHDGSVNFFTLSYYVPDIQFDITTPVSGPTRTIGTETTSYQRYPLDAYYKQTRAQMIYLASEAGEAGTISKIRFQVYSSSDVDTFDIAEVWIGHTAATYLTGWIDNAAHTKVYGPAALSVPVVTSGEWFEITLSTPFAYDGTNNLVVSLYVRQTDTYENTYSRYYYSATADNKFYRGVWDDGDPLSIPGTYMGLSTFRPNIQLEVSGGGGGEESSDVEISITEPPNSAPAQVERATNPAFTGGTTIQSFASNYSLTDTPGTGTFYYRFKYRNQAGVETAYSPIRRIVIFDPVEKPTNFEGLNPTVNSITWRWTDNSSDEDGFEVQQPPNFRKADAFAATGTGSTVSVTETGLTENTECTRHCRAFANTTEAVTKTAMTYDPADFSSSSSSYTRGFEFTANKDITITKVMAYSGSTKAYIFEEDNTTAVRTITVSGSTSWPEYDVIPPLEVSAGSTYRIAVYTNPYYYTSKSNCSWTSDITVDCGCYYSGDTYPSTTNTSYVYGMVNFKYTVVEQVRNKFSAPSNEDTECTLVHDPTESDFGIMYGAGELLDQEFSDRISDFSVYASQTLAQSFTVGFCDTLAKVQVYITRTSSSTASITFELRNDSSGLPGTLINQVSRSDLATDDVAHWVDVTFPSTITLNPGQMYWIVCVCASADIQYKWAGSSSGSYEGGYEAGDQGSGWISWGYYDWCFKTYMQASGSDVNIFVAPPLNKNVGQTGVQVERATDESFTLNKQIVQAFAPTYSLTDTPATGTYYYRIIYRNQAGTETAYSPVKHTTILPSTNNPTGFEGLNPTANSITWRWTDNSGSEDGFEVQQPGTPDIWKTDAEAVPGSGGTGSVTETELSENTPYTRHCRAFVNDARSYTDASNTDTEYTLVHDPGDADITLADVGNGQVSVTVTKPVNWDQGSTAVYLERCLEGDWGAEYKLFGGGWTQTYAYTDTVPLNGVYDYRIKFRSQVPVETSSYVKSIDVDSCPIPELIADFTATPTDGTAPLVVSFTDTTTGEVDTWEWNFGDGITSAEQNPYHEYEMAGNFTVTLTVVGPGGTDVETKTNYIQISAPPTLMADFIATPTSGSSPLTVTFTDNSAGAETWSWNFGEGASPGAASTQGPHVVVYSTQGSKPVTLTITGPGGSDTETKNNYITVYWYELPDADFTVNTTSGPAPLMVTFTDASTGNDINQWLWSFGMGASPPSASGKGPHTVIYSKQGTQAVTLTVLNPDGGYDTKMRYITVTEPEADFTISPPSGVAPLDVIFTDNSTGSSINSWQWTFDSGANPETASGQGPHTVSYDTEGIYAVTLRVDDTVAGTYGTKTKYVIVTEPILTIYVSPSGDDAYDGYSWATAKQTIQAGINITPNGGVVRVADGTYTGTTGNLNLTLISGRTITLKSQNGPTNCIIDAEGSANRAFNIQNLTTASVIDGFTITGGNFTNQSGGGVFCYGPGANPTFANCIITGNTASVGGGVYCAASSNPKFVGCTIASNTADYGGGIFSYKASPSITDCTISDNTASAGDGGGIYFNSSATSSTPTITGCTISTNTATYGGGVSSYNASPIITDCAIFGNTVSYDGGGIYCYYCSTSPIFANCTISENVAAYGGGIYCYEASLVFQNCIIWGNTASTVGYQIYIQGASAGDLDYCCYADSENDITGTITPDAHCITSDPLFMTGPRGSYYLSQVASGQGSDSPCVNTGSDTSENLGLDKRTTRIDGVTDAGTVDMGYHYVP